MKLLVTGGRGFIGSHLVQELREHGHQVAVTDRENADLAIPGNAERLVSPMIDCVVHLAARYGRILCRDEPHRSVTDNTAATTELAAACAEHGVPVLYASSSEVYGDHGHETITEDSELRTPTTIYGLSKRWGEEALRLYLPPEKLTLVRLNMLYGPRQRAGYGCCALVTFIDQALRGEPFTVHRGTTRSWLYITDAVRALRLLIEGRKTGTFNLGNDRETRSMWDAGAEVALAAGSAGIEVVDPPPDQIRNKNYSVRKLRETIDWEPQVALRVGIERTVEWARTEGFRDYSGERDADRT